MCDCLDARTSEHSNAEGEEAGLPSGPYTGLVFIIVCTPGALSHDHLCVHPLIREGQRNEVVREKLGSLD